MSSNSSSIARRSAWSLALIAWVFVGFMLAQAGIFALMWGLESLGVNLSAVNGPLLNVIGGVAIYGLAIAIVIGLPWLVRRRPTTLKQLGLHRLPRWRDIGWLGIGVVSYLILTMIVQQVAGYLFPFVNYDQAQETGYAGISTHLEYILAFIGLVIVAPFAEEVLFRGYLLGKLRQHVALWLSIVLTSLLFAFVHFQWNVGIDVFALSIVLCILRVKSDSLWASILLHMTKNGIAFYFLFINPSLLGTMG